MGSGGVEIESAVIRMGEKIGGELVVIPHESVLDIVLDAVEGDLGELLVHHKLVEALHAHVDGKCLHCRLPRMLLLSIGVIEGKDTPLFPGLHIEI